MVSRRHSVCVGSSGESWAHLQSSGTLPTPILFDDSYKFEIGKAHVMREGKDVALFATGHMTAQAYDAALELDKTGISAAVVNVSTIKPLDAETILATAAKSRQ